MSKRLFSPKQIADLLRNKNVAKCSDRSISCKPEFKIEAVRQYEEEGRSAKEIFIGSGFDLSAIRKEAPEEMLKRWRKIKRLNGVAALSKEARGTASGPGVGRPKTDWKSDAERIEYLEAKVEYLKAENSFLAKLRSGKTE